MKNLSKEMKDLNQEMKNFSKKAENLRLELKRNLKWLNFLLLCRLLRRLCRLAMTGNTTNIRLFLWIATNLALPNSRNNGLFTILSFSLENEKSTQIKRKLTILGYFAALSMTKNSAKNLIQSKFKGT